MSGSPGTPLPVLPVTDRWNTVRLAGMLLLVVERATGVKLDRIEVYATQGGVLEISAVLPDPATGEAAALALGVPDLSPEVLQEMDALNRLHGGGA